jgi:primosomal protein N' (replication factor Y)
VKGWILGPASETHQGRLLRVRKVRSPVRFFDPDMLALFSWMSERYIAPLATVIERSHPPRVASAERDDAARAVDDGAPPHSRLARRGGGLPGSPLSPLPATVLADSSTNLLARYGGSEALLEPGTTSWLRPLPKDEVDVCVATVGSCLKAGRQAIVLVPEADPLPATAAAVLEAFGQEAVAFLGGDGRERYRTWLDILAGRFGVVVGTRPAVFAPVRTPGLIWVSREVHPGHREERSPYYHVREVVMARGRLHGASCVMASLSPSVITAVAADLGSVRTVRPSRSLERAAAPLVETTPPEAADTSARLGALLKRASSAALIVSRSGYGVARICRSCGEPAACAFCRGPIVVESGRPICRVCGRPGECAVCRNRTFGIERGGSERVAEWARRISPLEVDLDPREGPHPVPGPGRTVVGTAATVKDVGPLELGIVAILDPDRALSRPGTNAGEQALATWMEASAWAASREAGGRVLLQTRRAGHPAIQALVRWEPVAFLQGEARRLREAGFPPGHHLFRIEGSGGLEDRLRDAGATTVLGTTGETGSLCLAVVPPEGLPAFRQAIVGLAGDGTVTRVEAEPQL